MSNRPLLVFKKSIVPYPGGKQWRAAINSVTDADTVWVERDTGCRHTQLIEIRVTGANWRGFNAAERFTLEGRALTQVLKGFCEPGSVILIETAIDTEKYGRWLSPLYWPLEQPGVDTTRVAEDDTYEIGGLVYLDLAAHFVRNFPEAAKWQEY